MKAVGRNPKTRQDKGHLGHIWSPSLKCDIASVETVQRKFTKRLPGYSDLSYAERRAKLNLQTLELRRLHCDLVLCYKIAFGIVKLQFSDFLYSVPCPLVVIHINCKLIMPLSM